MHQTVNTQIDLAFNFSKRWGSGVLSLSSVLLYEDMNNSTNCQNVIFKT